MMVSACLLISKSFCLFTKALGIVPQAPIKTGITVTFIYGGAHGVMVIVTGYGHGETSSNPGSDWLHFT